MRDQRGFADASRFDNESMFAPRVQPPELRHFPFSTDKRKRGFHWA
jgi:hypothetical protein